jgi:hypothetical protein
MRRGRVTWSLAVAAAGIALAGWAPARAGAAETGVNIAINQTVDGPATSQAAGVGWVRLFVGWSAGEPQRGQYDEFYLGRVRSEVAAFRARGIRTLLVVSGTPGWAAGPRGAGLAEPRDPGEYADFVAHLAATVPGIGAIEIWNEADSETFWAGAPDPRAYAALLRASYPAIKARDPNITVVSTGMVGNNYAFLSDVYAAGGGGSFDAVGVHTDTACLLTSPSEYYREPNGRVGRYSFTGYREVYDVMTANGDAGKAIWMTEIGWNTGSTKPRSCRSGAVAGTRAEGVSERTQARFLTLAYRCLAADPYVHVALWFSLQDVGHGAGYGDHLGLVRRSGSRKPAFRAMREVRNGRVRAARCGSVSDRAPPALDVRAPTEGAVLTSGENLPVRVYAADNAGGTGMRRVELFVDGRRVRVWGGGRVVSSWFGFRRVGFGTHTVVVRALDRAQNRSQRAFTIRKVTPGSLGDRARPVVRWRRLPRRTGATARIAVRVVDRGPAGLRKATLYVNGRRVRTRKRDGLWSTRVSFGARGRQRLTLRAEDRAGNVTRSRRHVVRR